MGGVKESVPLVQDIQDVKEEILDEDTGVHIVVGFCYRKYWLMIAVMSQHPHPYSVENRKHKSHFLY